MFRKTLGFLVVCFLFILPMTKVKTVETERLLARAVTQTARGASYETMLSLLTVAANRAGDLNIADIERALRMGGFSRRFHVEPRALEAAHALVLGERTFDERVKSFSMRMPEGKYERVGHFYFF